MLYQFSAHLKCTPVPLTRNGKTHRQRLLLRKKFILTDLWTQETPEKHQDGDRGRGGDSVARTCISNLTGRGGQDEVGMLSNLRIGEFE